MIINPLKTYAVKVLNEGKEKIIEQTMSYMDAAKIAIILAIAGYFTAFLPGFSYEQIIVDLGIFCFNSTRYIGSTFFTYFVVFAGLSKWTSRKEE